MERVSLESFLREFLERASGESFWRELLERVSESVEDFLDWLSSSQVDGQSSLARLKSSNGVYIYL